MDKVPVNRLLDIVVEEVSLVDHAANKRRFLLVKRSEDMGESNPDTNDGPAETGETTSDATTPANGADPLLSTAVAALESLTSVVEALGNVGDSPDGRIAPLAAELSQTANQLLERAGLSPIPEPQNENADPFTAKLAEARAAIAQLNALKSPPVPATKAQEPGTDFGKALANIAENFKTLSDAIKEQNKRLASVEKNVGLPQSRQEPPAKTATPESIGWPLDLNQPMDRESVDKRVSFHDL